MADRTSEQHNELQYLASLARKNPEDQIVLQLTGQIEIKTFLTLKEKCSGLVEEYCEEYCGNQQTRHYISSQKNVWILRKGFNIITTCSTLRGAGFSAACINEVIVDTPKDFSVTKRRFCRRTSLYSEGYISIFTEVVTERQGSLPRYSLEIQIRVLPDANVEIMQTSVCMIGMPQTTFKWPAQCKSLFSKVHNPKVRDLTWKDLQWGGPVFGDQRFLSMKLKNDGLRGVLFYVAHSHELVLKCGAPRGLETYCVERPMTWTFLLDGEFSRDGTVYNVFDIAFLDGWLSISRRKRYALLKQLLEVLKTDFIVKASEWKELPTTTDVAEHVPQTIFEPFVHVLEEMESVRSNEYDGVILSKDDMPWSPRPNLVFVINTFKIKPNHCTVDLAVFSGHLYAESNSTVSVLPWQTQPMSVWSPENINRAFGPPDHFIHITGPLPVDYVDGTVVECLFVEDDLQVICERPDKFRKPNPYTQFVDVQQLHYFPITAYNLRKYAAEIHRHHCLVRVCTELHLMSRAKLLSFPDLPQNYWIRSQIKPLAKNELADVLVVNIIKNAESLTKVLERATIVIFTHNVDEFPYSSVGSVVYTQAMNDNPFVAAEDFKKLCRMAVTVVEISTR